MNNKIALISPHNDPNFGTMLQAYALSKAIENLGYSSEYISYNNFIKRSPLEKALYYLLNPNLIIARLRKKKVKTKLDDYSFFRSDEFTNTIHEFNKFYQEYIPSSIIKYDPKSINSITGYNKYIVGSDQTWSPNLLNPYTINFLDFVRDDHLKHSYAPSLGSINIPNSFHCIIKEKLSKFENLSCREKTNCSLIEDLISKKVTHVLDPTLLLTPEQWNTIAKEVNMPQKYILCYILGEKKCISDFADKLGNNENIPVYYVVTRPLYLEKENILKGMGPSQFISLIKNATYVITDSFHGTLFSINYNIKFYSFDKREQKSKSNDNGRIMEVLKDFKLINRYKSEMDLNFEKDIIFDNSDVILKKRRIESLNYLKQIIQ